MSQRETVGSDEFRFKPQFNHLLAMTLDELHFRASFYVSLSGDNIYHFRIRMKIKLNPLAQCVAHKKFPTNGSCYNHL